MKMSAQLSFALFACVMAPSAHGQLIAGVIPAWYTETSYSFHLEPLVDFTEEMADFDVDCDGIDDLRLFLDRNNPSIDASNRLYLRSLVDSIRICVDDMGVLCPNFNHSLNYVAGQAMTCASPFALLSDANVVVGDHVTFLCGGVAPESADSVYIHYEKTTNGNIVEGWIFMSYDIVSTNTIDPWAEVHGAIGICGTNGIEQRDKDGLRIVLYPNPTPDGRIKWSSSSRVISVEIFDMLGQRIDTGEGGSTGSLALDVGKGSYVLLFRTENGHHQVERLIH